MKAELIRVIACPGCRSESLELRPRQSSGEEVESGEIECMTCHRFYPIEGGVPRLLPERSRGGSEHREASADGYAEGLRETIDQYSSYQRNVFAELADRLDNDAILRARTGLERADFEGRVCLDAGCGVGRMARLMAASGARMVVGLDAGLAVEEAARRSREIPGLFWVQGDILRPPFRLGAFNRVISLGVLHHTMEPDRGFRAISDLVQDDGSLSVYVYHRDYYDWRQLNAALRVLGDARRSLIGEPLRRLIVKLPESARYAFCSALWERRRAIEHVRAQPVVGRALARILELSTPADVFKPLENRESNVARSYDLYSTPYNYSHDLVEVIDWFERDGRYAELTVTPYRISVTGFRGARGRNDALRIRYFASKSSEEVEASGIASAMTAD